jgi:hypothetical protein
MSSITSILAHTLCWHGGIEDKTRVLFNIPLGRLIFVHLYFSIANIFSPSANLVWRILVPYKYGVVCFMMFIDLLDDG